ncbi:hypothetical protein VNO77_19707 [Canavalia gladiata]|uniref:Uncharacterized protein n=1 Tax=Canavalia gladiata TaxID=3824 RepID=A0AAN9QKP3_CANGL
MAAQVSSFHVDSRSKIVPKNTSPRCVTLLCSFNLLVLSIGLRVMRVILEFPKNISNTREELLKALIRKRTTTATNGNNVIQSKPLNDSNKMPFSTHNQQNHGGKELLKVVRKGTEKLNIKESKCKSTRSKMCFCSPTTHEGSFRCRLHRINASKKSTIEKSNLRSNSKCTHGMVEFKPQLSRFGRVASGEVGPRDSQIQLSGVESA